MRILILRQGSPEWLEHRRTKFNASDAPAMLGESPYCSRSELLHRMFTGIVPEVDAATQRRFDAGHRVEALLRKVAEQIVGEPLHPFVGVADFDGRISASFDGCTFVGDETAECKLLNERLRAAFSDMESIAPEHRERSAAKCLPIDYRIQMEQQARIANATRVLFLAGELREDGTLGDTFSCWYYPDADLWQRILAGWRQFDADLAVYVPPVAEAPQPVGRAPDTLPALRIEITGAVTASNLAEFRETALGAIRSVNRELTTDAHFADAEQAVKWCGEVESRIKAAKEHALSQTASIEALFRTLDDVSAEARRVRLDLEKLVERRKVEIKGEMVAAAKAAYERHEAALRQECGAWRLLTPPDFAGAIKGKRNVAAMQDALDTALANAKIKADEQARTIRAALGALDEEAKGFEHLFRDRMDFMMLPPDVVRQMARGRIAEHKAAEERRAAGLAERERARIRAEEEARAAEKLRQEQAAREAEERRQQAAAEDAQRASLAAAAEEQRRQEVALAEQERRSEEALRQALPAAGPAVIPMPTRAPAAPAPRTLTLGAISQRLGFNLPAAFVAEKLGIEGERDRSAVKFSEREFVQICAALAHHIGVVLEEHRQQRVA